MTSLVNCRRWWAGGLRSMASKMDLSSREKVNGAKARPTIKILQARKQGGSLAPFKHDPGIAHQYINNNITQSLPLLPGLALSKSKHELGVNRVGRWSMSVGRTFCGGRP